MKKRPAKRLFQDFLRLFWLLTLPFLSAACAVVKPWLVLNLEAVELCTSPTTPGAHPAPWMVRHCEAMNLYRAGEYDLAIGMAYKALDLADQNVAPNHPDVATILYTLAAFHQIRGERAKADLLYRQALTSFEMGIGSDHPETATKLERLADLYQAAGRNAEAEAVRLRAAQIRDFFAR